MVETKNGTDSGDNGMDHSDYAPRERRSGERGSGERKGLRAAGPAPNLPAIEDRRVALIPALRVILASAERTVGPPLGENKRLVGSLRRLRALLGRLRRMSDAEFISALEALAGERDQSVKENHAEGGSRPLADLSLHEVEQIISEPKITKQRLLAIVRERFGASTGTLAKLRHQAIVERIAAMAMNERSHETVARLASGAQQYLPVATAQIAPHHEQAGKDDQR